MPNQWTNQETTAVAKLIERDRSYWQAKAAEAYYESGEDAVKASINLGNYLRAKLGNINWYEIAQDLIESIDEEES
jgi:hypothetical protein